MNLLAGALAREVPSLHKEGVKLHFLGEREGLSEKVQAGFLQAEALTASNECFVLNVCFNYGGRADIVQAAARLAAQGQVITEQSLSEAMVTAHVSDPDLLIRTGGELRVSNFLLWQVAYSELYFSPVLWPEFDAPELDAALDDFACRERRFGQISEQIT